ncbi:hypothetical protein Q7689_09875 [Nocardiopsis tropica]|nr:hypothetical protein [Nocardiopsis tropica]
MTESFPGFDPEDAQERRDAAKEQQEREKAERDEQLGPPQQP